MSHEHRIKIQNSKVLSHLQSFFETGKPALTDSQVRVGIALLKKVLPDLQSMTISGDAANPLKLDITRIERVVVDAKS